MEIRVVSKENSSIAVISSDEVIIADAQDALDVISTIRYDYECDKMIINMKSITEEFFDLQSGIAGEIMQKYINYEMPLAIVGEFEQFNSTSLKSLIYESNIGNKITFRSTEAEALELL